MPLTRDIETMQGRLEEAGLGHWLPSIGDLLRERLSPGGHGDFLRWAGALRGVRESQTSPGDLRDALLALTPWRKGPFDLGGVHIDAEWRSDLKWSRLADGIAPLTGRRVLDVGSGNGYYALRMREAGADFVVGVDPTLLYVLQFLAIDSLRPDPNVVILPLRFEEAPAAEGLFDTTFSMGVLYHQRSPADHLASLRATLRRGGQLVLETLYLPGDDARAFTPPDRYARMRNVWLLPTLAELRTWLARTGYRDIEVVDTSVTTTAEQRSTEWMTFESLREALDPVDSSRTIEGLPAPRRVVVTATNPAS